MTSDRSRPTRWRPGTRFYVRSGTRTVVRVVAIVVAVAILAVLAVVCVVFNIDFGTAVQVLAYVLFALAVVVVSVWAVIKRFYLWLRRHDFVKLARENGFAFAKSDDRLCTVSKVDPFQTHSKAWTRDVVSGWMHNRQVTFFRYIFRITESSSPALRSSRICIVELPGRYADFELRVDDYVVTSVTPGLLPMDVDIEDEEFNRRYRVSAKDTASRNYATDILNPRVVEWLLSTEPFPVRIEGRLIIGWWSDTVSPDSCLRRAQALAGAAANLPAFRAE